MTGQKETNEEVVGKPETILVVDDEKSIRVALKKILERAGYYVETSPDFQDAKKRMENLNFDLLVLDIILPGINGVEILQILRNEGIQTPVVFITGEPNFTTALEALRLGAYDYIEKPVRKHDLVKVVKHALEKARMAKDLEVARKFVREMRELFSDVDDAGRHELTEREASILEKLKKLEYE
ncbi:MAG: hypothetical protein Kow0069_23410 [Promethearchaeota archaeon]